MRRDVLKTFSLIFATVFVFCACSTDKNSLPQTPVGSSSIGESGVTSAPAVVSDNNFILPYDVNDSLNPLLSLSSFNTALHSLVYDSLVKLDNDFTPVMLLASDIEISGTECTVTVKDGVKFSDGSDCTASDVKYSLDYIKTTGGTYAKRLSNVRSYTIMSPTTLVINLSVPDHLFINLLDFPVIKSGTFSEDHPIGCGRYVYSESSGNHNEVLLTANPSWHGGTIKAFKNITLTPYEYSESIIHSLKMGKINFTFSDLSQVQSSTNMGSNPIQVSLTNLVYLGLNNTTGYTATASFRKALSLCLNRSKLVTDGFFSRANATSTPFNPNMYATKDLPNQLTADIDGANSILDALGYTSHDDEGFRLSGANRVTLNLLVNTENLYRTQSAAIIKNALKDIGIDCVITEQNFISYTSSVEAGSFDMYIGEVKLYANNDLSEFLDGGGSLAYGGTANAGLSAAYAALRSGQSGYEAFCTAFTEQSPFIPLVFRSGISCFTKTMSFNVKSSMSDVFFNIEDWEFTT